MVKEVKRRMKNTENLVVLKTTPVNEIKRGKKKDGAYTKWNKVNLFFSTIASSARHGRHRRARRQQRRRQRRRVISARSAATVPAIVFLQWFLFLTVNVLRFLFKTVRPSSSTTGVMS